MLNITKEQNGSSLCYRLEGRLDTTTSPELEEDVRNSLNGITDLVFDLEKLEYISSAGLRIILSSQKIMNRQGQMRVRGVAGDVREVFKVTGFLDILTLE